MNKSEFISALELMKKSLEELKKRVNTREREFVYGPDLNQSKSLSSQWFEELHPLLPRYGVPDAIIAHYRHNFEELLRISMKRQARKTTYLGILSQIVDSFDGEILIPVHQTPREIASTSHLAKILHSVSSEEREYLVEALECVQHNLFRAAVILGWCAAVHRMQKTIERLGFDEFNQKTREMKAKKGRYKRFNQAYDISSLDDFRATIFDRVMLLVLEYWGLITYNQSERLFTCYLLRNNAAHPGEAPITEENLASFFSDLRLFVFENPNFTL